MAEARIIPIKGDPVEKPDEAPSQRRRSPNGTARRSAPKRPADELPFDGGVAAEPEPATEKTEKHAADGKKPSRRRKPVSSGEPKPTTQPAVADAVQPPEEVRDLDSVVAGGP